MAHKSCREPPFSREVAPHKSDITLSNAGRHGDALLDPSDDVRLHLQWDLQTPRVAKVEQYLWISGLPRLARTLHRQRQLLRAIYVTEDPNEHMVWQDQCMSIKPLPEYLLNSDFWVRYIIHDEELCRSARGLLLSYAWLVAQKNDFHIASDMGLIPSSIDYHQWMELRSEVLRNVDRRTLHQSSPRWSFAKLCLNRANSLIWPEGGSLIIQKSTHEANINSSDQSDAFFMGSLSWILILLASLNVVPLSLQGALGTKRTNRKAFVHSLSSGMGPTFSAFVFLALLSVLIMWWTAFRAHLSYPARQLEGSRTLKSVESTATEFLFEPPLHVCSLYQDGGVLAQ
ncbi:hypothetical protein HJFPF1_12544 [Paramyrothecium foliicola]|nr:hypothetical protein HJFPF1_12544 [Paramyrothecium foliicola]